MRTLHPAAGAAEAPSRLPDVPFEWVSAAWCRACLHDNPAMRKAAMLALGDSEWRGALAAAMPECDVLGPMLRALCDPIHYAAGAADERCEAAALAFWQRPPAAVGVALAAAARVGACATAEERRQAARRVVAATAGIATPSRGGAAALLLVVREACEAAGLEASETVPDAEQSAADVALEQLRVVAGLACAQWGEAYRGAAARNAVRAAAALAPPPGVSPAAAARLLAEVARGGGRAGAPRAAAAAWLAAPGERQRWLAQAVRNDVATFLEGSRSTDNDDASSSNAAAYPTPAETAEWKARARQLALLAALLPSGGAGAAPSAVQQHAWGCADDDDSVLAPLAAAAGALYRRSYPPRGQPQRAAALVEAVLQEAADEQEAPAWLQVVPPALLRGCIAPLAACARAAAAPLLARPEGGGGESVLAAPATGGGGRAYRCGPPPALAPRRAASGAAAAAALAACAAAARWRPQPGDEAASAAWTDADASLWSLLADVAAAAAWWDDPDVGTAADAAALAELKCAALGLVSHAATALASPAAAPPPDAAFAPSLFAAVAAVASRQHAARRGAGDNAAVWRALSAVLRLPGAAAPPTAAHALALGAAVAAVRVTARTEVPPVLRAARALFETLLDAPTQLAAAAAAAAAASGEADLADLDADGGDDEARDVDGEDIADSPCMDDDAAQGDHDADEAALDAELGRCPVAPLCASLSRCAWACVSDCEDSWPLSALAELLATALHPALFARPHLHARRRGPLRRLLRRLLRLGGTHNPRLMRLASAATWALWLRFPDVASRGRYAPEMLRIALYAGIATDAEAATDEPRGAEAAAEAFAAMPGGADVGALAAVSGEARAARAAAVVGAAAMARLGADGNASAADAAAALLRRALRGVVAHPDLSAEAYRRGGPTHARKIRVWQLLAALVPALPAEGDTTEAAAALAAFLDATLWRALDMTNTPCVMQYAERLAAAYVLRSPGLLTARVLQPLLVFAPDVPSPPAGMLVSRLLVAHACVRFVEPAQAARALPAVLAAATPHVTAHNHALRTVAQLVLRDIFLTFPPDHAAWGAGGLAAGAAGAAALQLRAALCDGSDYVAAAEAAGPLATEHPLEACAPARVLAAGDGDAVLRLEGAPAPLAERVTNMLDQLRAVTRAGRAAAEGALLAAQGSSSVPATPAKPLDALQRKMQPGGGSDALAAALAASPGGEASADGGAPGDALVDSAFGAAVTRTCAAAGAQRQQLIVIASLVDNAPNLGGLARTSEVFRLARLVVADAAVTATQTFKQLAVTADKWLPIAAVSPAALPAYLAARRADGFSIVALEQTTASVPLPGFAWPRRAVLLLGAEGSGVPPHLLALCDACVEIPQLGMVRSLNVHVSASLAAYSYTVQHGLPL